MAVNARIKDLAPGSVFDIGPAKAVILEHLAGGKTLLATAESIGDHPFTVRPFTYNRIDPEPAANNFAFSTLKAELNGGFLDAVADAGVIPVDRIAVTSWDLSDHDGGNRYGRVECKIGLLTEPQVRRYFAAGLLKIEDWEWTLTPYAGSAYYVRRVSTDGTLSYRNAYGGSDGVRPALVVDSDIFLSLEPDEVDLSDSALLREFSSRQLVEEVLRRIADGEEDDDLGDDE